jgi:exocyst complex protein 7
MAQLTAYQDIAENFLQTLGDGNWLMGGVAPGGSRRQGNSLLEKYLGASPRATMQIHFDHGIA